jgi:hypothetical protein
LNEEDKDNGGWRRRLNKEDKDWWLNEEDKDNGGWRKRLNKEDEDCSVEY